MGDHVKVRVARVSLTERKIDFPTLIVMLMMLRINPYETFRHHVSQSLMPILHL